MTLVPIFRVFGSTATTLSDRVTGLGPVSYYRLNEGNGLTIDDQRDVQDGAIVDDAGIQRDQPTIADLDPGGLCLGFDGGHNRISIPFHPDHKTPSGGVGILIQPDQIAVKQIVVASDEDDGTGGWSLEILAGGQVRGFLWAAGNVLHEVFSGAGAITAGNAYHLALTWGHPGDGPGGLRLYVDGTLVDVDDTITSGADLSNSGEITVSGWHTGVDKVKGLLAHLVVFGTQPSDQDVGNIALPRNVTHANPDTGSTVQINGPAVTVDVLANDHYQGTKAGATIAITAQGALGVWAVDGNNDLTYTPGPTVGMDTAGRYTVNGSNQALLEMPVVPQGASNADVPMLGQWYGASVFGHGWGNLPLGASANHAYRFRAERSGTIDTLRWICPIRENYVFGTGGICRIRIRADDGTSNHWPGSVLWTSASFTGIAAGTVSGWTYYDSPPTKEHVELPIGPVALTAGTIYHIEFQNLDTNNNNRYSINHFYTDSLYDAESNWSDYPPFANPGGLSLLIQSGGNWNVGNKWVPHFQIRYTDGIWTGQGIVAGFSAGTPAKPSDPTTQPSAREIRNDNGGWQSRQRFGPALTYTVDRIYARVWRRTSDTGGNLVFRIEREESGGGVTTLRTANVAASSVHLPTPVADDHNQSGQAHFAVLKVDIPDTVLNANTWHRLRVSASSTAIFCMRAYQHIGISSGHELQPAWNLWYHQDHATKKGRAEYSTNAGSSWTGMHMFGTNNRSDLFWMMGFRVKSFGQ